MVESPLTFKERVSEFWAWFATVHERFFAEIEAGRCGDLQPETSATIGKLFPGFAWVFGPGEDGVGHSLTLSGEGVIHRQLLSQHWLQQAPEFPGWTFYCSRQPGFIDGRRFIIGDHSFDFEALWISPSIDSDNECVDIHVWHPLFEKIPEQRNLAMFLMLDEALGEFGVEMWLGSIKISDKRLADAMPLSELRGFVESIAAQHEWKAFPPGQSTSLYRFEEPPGEFSRCDTFSGITRNFRLIREYFRSDGEMEDPIEGTGAEFVYVSFTSEILPKGDEVGYRGGLEDDLAARLQRETSGEVLGGACGTEQSYIDVLIYDGDHSLALIHNFLVEQGLPPGTAIQFFASGNEGRRLFL